MGCVAAMCREPIKAQGFEWAMTHCEPKAPHYLSQGPPTLCLPMTVPGGRALPSVAYLAPIAG